MKTDTYGLRLVGSCPDQPGIIAKVSGHLTSAGANINEASQYKDERSSMFFMRYVFNLAGDGEVIREFTQGFNPVAEQLNMEWRLTDVAYRKRIVLLVSKFDHCLAYILHRWKVGDLKLDIPCVISNHEDLRELVEWYGIPYHHIPVSKEAAAKKAAFEETARKIEEAEPDTIVLARYMQIFPEWLCTKYRYRVINIHHSFLPSFIGARPYHQAEERGVKLIGATCHYVTEELDAGPIIEQDVIRIRHDHSIEDMIRLGKDVENQVLSRGLRYHLEDRVIVHSNKTVLFV
ncbi:MAG: formyltetrahydrofolate deformylase [Verrucomicrobiota bacterium]